MINPAKLVGFVYDSPLPFEQKSKLASLVIYGDENDRRDIYFFVRDLSEKYHALSDPENITKMKKKAGDIKQRFFTAAEKTMRKIENNSLQNIEKNIDFLLRK